MAVAGVSGGYVVALILASTILSSVPAAVDKTLEQLQDEERILARLAEAESKLANVEKVADATSACVRSAFAFAGGDQLSTAASLKWCKDCEEQNPLGFNAEARIGLKLAQLGVQIDECYRAAKKGKQAAGAVTWINRVITGFAILTNTYAAVSGKPLIRWRESK